MKGLRKALLPALMALGFASSGAHAGFLVEDWDLNLGAVAGQGLVGTVAGIDEITYKGVARATNTDSDLSGTPTVGDAGTVFGALTATSYQIGGNTSTGFPAGGGLNGGYEMTFTFQIDSVLTAADATGTEQTHLAAGSIGTVTTGRLTIYIDNLLDLPGAQSSTLTGLGYNDGNPVATFLVIAGGGGPFSFLTLDGSDDATFILESADAGVFTKGGVDLGLLVGELMVMTDSNFDADPDNNGALTGFPVPTSTAVLGGGCPGGIGFNCFYAFEDGSAVLAVPEPGSLALLGTGLLGMWGLRRRRSHA